MHFTFQLTCIGVLVLFVLETKAQPAAPVGVLGECSFYGREGEIPEGAYTACGDGFHRMAMTASQLGKIDPKLKCGTKVRVTNVSNGKSVDVVLNDRGTEKTRTLDLTYGAFEKVENIDKGKFQCSYIVLENGS